MCNIVCVNWGDKYPVSYTERLYNMVRRNTERDFTFYVLTDNVTLYDKFPHITAIELDTVDVGWWNKLQMFKPGVLPNGEYLYFDLDVVIVSSIDCFLDHPDFGITRDFIRPDVGLLGNPEFNSSVLRFNNTRCEGIYQYYIQNVNTWKAHQQRIHFFGDQNVISEYVNHYPDFLNAFPDEWLWSFKKGVERGKHAGDRSKMFGRDIPSGARVCVFHGNPNPTEVDVKWVKDHYR